MRFDWRRHGSSAARFDVGEVMDGHTPVYTIPTGAPFLSTLAGALVEGRLIAGWPRLDDPLSLSEGTVFVPTRRAARALTEAIKAQMPGRTVLMPRIVPLGGLEDTEEKFLIESGLGTLGSDATLRPEIDPMHRRLVLTRLVLAWAKRISEALSDDHGEHPFSERLKNGILSDPNGFAVATSPQDALGLADALGQLIDTLAIYGKTWEEIHRLVADDLADQYWAISKDFLEIAAREWPRYCDELGVMDAAERRHKLILNEAARLKRDRPLAPVIAAGSTGSMPATAALLSAIAALPRGAVILPGLDQRLDPLSWEALTGDKPLMPYPGHPQALLARLLIELGIRREEVKPIGRQEPLLAEREVFLSEALKPAETTDQWHSSTVRERDGGSADALPAVSIVEADNEHEQALAIAVAMRGALEVPERIAALVTPDRALAERVSVELRRWGIDVGDSAGLPLSRSSAGIFAQLAVDAAIDGFGPHSLLALIDHPLAVLGMDPLIKSAGRNAIEIGILRRRTPSSGLVGLRAEIDRVEREPLDHHAARPVRRITESDWDAARKLVDQLILFFAAFQSSSRSETVSLTSLPRLHREVLLALTARPDGSEALSFAEGGESLLALFESVSDALDRDLTGRLADYPAFFRALASGETVVRRGPHHRRLHIWGLLEARLLRPDLMILGGLDEKTWPPDTNSDPFLNRPARDALNLPSPERRIGQTAHDFVQAMGAREIIITRAMKSGGDPNVASRFLQRMGALAGGARLQPAIRRGNALLGLARLIDQSTAVPVLQRPAPVLAPHLLPRRLSVTEIETLRRDPYAIYAKHVLELDPLEPIGREPGAAERGTAVHQALHEFCLAHPGLLPADAIVSLEHFAWKAFDPISHLPEFTAFWWPRFQRAAHWFISWERKHRNPGTLIKVEETGRLVVKLPGGGEFTLSARADRIEIAPDKSFVIIDYKTGRVPGINEARIGFSPQLTLEAAMVKRGAFANIDATRPTALFYVKLMERDGGFARDISKGQKEIDPDSLCDAHFEQFIDLIDAHWNRSLPFYSRPAVRFLKDAKPFDHLARVREWTIIGDAEAGGDDQ